MTAPALRFLYFIEALAFSAYVGWYIWQLESSNWSSWIVFPVWLIASIIVHKDTPKTLGWRADNLWNAAKRSAVLFLPSILLICAVGIAFGRFALRQRVFGMDRDFICTYGDHLPGARDAVQAGPVRSPVTINWSIASLLAPSAALMSAIASSLARKQC